VKTRAEFENYCRKNGFELSDHADKIIAAIDARNGHCPCRTQDVPCPCPTHMEEIEETSSCHCNLFKKKYG
jgi:ferredoxin-thioredoxin reductase catalytic subunit